VVGAVAAVIGAAAPRAESKDVTGSPTQPTTSETAPLLSLDAVRDIAASSPSAGVAVLSLLDPATAPFSDSTANDFIYLAGAPTQRTAELMLSGADASAVARSLSQIPFNPYSMGNPYVQIHWDKSDQPNGDVLVRVSAEIVAHGGCEMELYESLEPDTLIWLRRTKSGALAWREASHKREKTPIAVAKPVTGK
jgi:hypothetical protein